MKRLCSKVMLIAAAAIAFFACQKSEVEAPKFVEVNGLSFSSEKPSYDGTKTQWVDETKTIQWSAGDKIRVAYTCDGVWQNADGTSKSGEESGSKTAKIYESKAITEAGSTASFSVPGNFKGTAEGVYVFYGIYPSSLVSSADIKYAPSVTITIPTIQTPSVSSFDSSADVMASKSQSYSGIPENEEKREPISLKWERMVAHGHLTLKEIPVVGTENIQSITLTANADADMVGTHYLYLDTYNVVKPNSNAATNSITIDARNLSIDSEGNVTFWASFLPCTWTSIDVKAETDKAIYTRSIDLTDNIKTFAQNARNTLAINMKSAVREVKGASSLPFVQDFSEMTGQSEITKLEGFSSIGGKVYNAAGAIRLASGSAEGSITTQLLDLSQNFHVKVTASGWDSDELSLIVSTPNQTENITLITYGTSTTVGEFTEHIINFQPVSNSASVKFEAETKKRCHIKRIEVIEGHVELPSRLTATTPSEMLAAGGTGEFSFTLTNPKEGKNVIAASSVDWITNVSVGDGKVTYNVAENTTEESREGVITLTYEGVDPVNVTISQAAAEQTGGDEGGDSEVKAWTLVTSVSELAIGDEIIIAAKDYNYAVGPASSNGNNRTQAAITKSGNILTTSDGVTILTLQTGTVDGTYALYTGTKYLYAASSSQNYLKETASKDANGSWKISISSDGTASVVAQGTNSRNTMQYNPSSSLFNCYSSASQKAIVIYKQMPYSGEGGGTTPEPEQPDPTPDSDTFTKYTGELTEGDYIIVYQNGAMKNTESSDRLQYTEVAPEGDVISSPDAAIVWHIAKSGDYWTIYNAAVGKYAASTGAKNKAQLLTTGTDNKSLWTVTGTATYEFVNKANKTGGVNCNLRRNGTYGFACYATSTGGALTLYKKN